MLYPLEAGRADSHLLDPVCFDLDGVEIGLKTPLTAPLRVGDPATGKNSFVTEITDLSHRVINREAI